MLVTRKPHLVFISPRFLFPTDSGGKIRTTQILRGLKGGAFRVTLVMPGRPDSRAVYAEQLASVSDQVVLWPEKEHTNLAAAVRRFALLFSRYPLSVVSDFDRDGSRAVRELVDSVPDVVVFDFPHSAILRPQTIASPTVMFTHNVESEILERHWQVAKSLPMKVIWKNQYRKMCAFEQQTLSEFDAVVAVSERDRNFFADQWGIAHCRTIPTGVDTDFFTYQAPQSDPQVVFCGSMDWMANIDAVEYFFDEVWGRIHDQIPEARMKVVGRSPPDALVKRICGQAKEWEFTGFVDDVREHIGGAAAFVIPLRVGGGTRIKAFEAMAIGSPVVSTSIGIEGLPVVDGTHFLAADEPHIMADNVVSLLKDKKIRTSISQAARLLVEKEYSYKRAARKFEEICIDAADRGSGR